MLQLVSPALPVGAFSYSEGLEWLIQNSKITDEFELFDWLKSELLRGQIRIEAASQSPIREALQNWHINNSKNSKKLQLHAFMATHSLFIENWLKETTDAKRTLMGIVKARNAGEI